MPAKRSAFPIIDFTGKKETLIMSTPVIEPITSDMTQIPATPSPQWATPARPIVLYLVEVKSQGSCIAQHTVEAVDALSAINLVEPQYGEPVEVETVYVENEDGSHRQKLVVKNWHGYTFDARMIEP